ncbi:MAG TPA: 50S ribosomal protein L21 [Candidatus Limnocylindrales bacterium]|nr:50S ribosomal protein L21 [Candidatus Limnocylindrales bacterium]
MYAVIETGGKQYRVELGTELAVERLDAPAGGSVTLDRVLLVADGDEATIGRPLVADALVSADVIAQDRADKVVVFKYRPKARRRVKKGHRQERTVLRISDIRFNGRSAAEDSRQAEEQRKTERERLQEAAARQAAEDAALAAKLAERSGDATEPAKPARGRGRATATKAATAKAATAKAATAKSGTAKTEAATTEAPTTEPTKSEAKASGRPRKQAASTEATPKAGAKKASAEDTTAAEGEPPAPRARTKKDD